MLPLCSSAVAAAAAPEVNLHELWEAPALLPTAQRVLPATLGGVGVAELTLQLQVVLVSQELARGGEGVGRIPGQDVATAIADGHGVSDALPMSSTWNKNIKKDLQ